MIIKDELRPEDERTLTQEELLENLDRNYIHRSGISTTSDSCAYNQIKEIIKTWYKYNLWDLRVGIIEK